MNSKTNSILFGKFSWKRVMISIVEIYILLSLSTLLIANWMIHHPPARKYGAFDGEASLTTSDGVKLSAFWYPCPNATHTILFSHGNGEDLLALLPHLREFQRAGFNVFAYDYRGYGRSEGKPNEKGLYRDIEAAYAHLTGPLGIPSSKIIVLGRSLGSGPATYLASIKPVHGLFLESPYTSIYSVLVPFPLMGFDQFRNQKRLSKMDLPIFVLHGLQDEVISVSHGKKIYESYKGPKQCYWVEGAGHNNLIYTCGQNYFEHLKEFSKFCDENQRKTL
jgi:abhydrolase domain-containing protein 17